MGYRMDIVEYSTGSYLILVYFEIPAFDVWGISGTITRGSWRLVFSRACQFSLRTCLRRCSGVGCVACTGYGLRSLCIVRKKLRKSGKKWYLAEALGWFMVDNWSRTALDSTLVHVVARCLATRSWFWTIRVDGLWWLTHRFRPKVFGSI
jgi:hypothetical protein